MEILQIISSFPPAYAYGGALKTAYEVSKHLIKKGHSVTVYTTDVFDSKSRYTYEKNPLWLNGIEIHYFKNINNKLAYKNFPVALDMAFALNKNVDKFDLVHLHEYRTFQAYLTYKYAKKHDVPYLIQPHGSTVKLMGKLFMKKLFDIFEGNNIIKEASKIIALTEEEAKSIRRFDIDKKNIEIIPNGIDLSEFSNLPEKGEFRRKYNISNNKKLILFLGRLHKIKGIDLLLKSFADLHDENLILVIAGPDGGCLNKLKRLANKLKIEDQLIFTGPLYEKEKLKAFIDADLYVLTSFYETFPNSVLEACACGTPVIVSDRCGISSLIDNNVGLVTKYDSLTLKDVLHRILSDEKKREKFGKNGIKWVKNEFNWNQIVKSVEEAYISIL